MASLQDYREFRSKYNYYGHHLGVVITEMEEGRARCEMPVRQELYNPIGAVNGGALFSLADTTCTAAASAYGMRMTTLDSSFHFLAPALHAKVIYAEAIEIKKGRNTAVYDVKITDDNDTLLACGIFTFFDLHKPLIEGDKPESNKKKPAVSGKKNEDIQIPDIGANAHVKKSFITDHGTADDFPIDTIIC